ncbi:hypothetical protein GCM10028818_45460 [Spirosoma horti]
MVNSFGCFTQNDPHSSSNGGNTSNPPTSNPPSGNCAFSEGQFLLNWYGEQIYAHYANGILYAAYQNAGEGFKPQSWLQATGFDPGKVSCFAVNNPLMSTPIPPVTNPPTQNPPSGNCAYSEGQFLLNWYGEQIHAHYFNGILYAAYQDGSVGFKPRSWLSVAGYDASKLACFAQNDPHTTTTNNPTTNPQNPPSTAGNNLNGSFDYADCNSISGWIFNANTPNQSTKFDVYVNGWLAAAGVPATRSRQDVANALGVSGYNGFGFNLNLPNQYKAGVALTISVKYSGTNTHIPGSPKVTQTCPNSPSTQGFDPECQTGIASVFPRSGQARSSAVAHTGSISLQLMSKGANNITSLTSRLIPVKQGILSLNAYAFALVQSKPNLTPQLTAAAVGGVLAGLALTQKYTVAPDQRHVNKLAPTLGVSTALMVPLVKSLLANRVPNAGLELAFYNKQGRFMHRQQVEINKTAREGWQVLRIDGQAPEDGYAVIRLHNYSKVPVYFDDVALETTPVQSKSELNNRHLTSKLFHSANGFVAQQFPNEQNTYSMYDFDSPCHVHAGGAIIDPDSNWPGVWLDIDVTVTATPAGAEPTGSTGGGTTYTQSGSDTFTPNGTPTRPPVGTTYTSSSGVTYIWDGINWCIVLKEVDVKGNHPSNPPDGYIHIHVDPNFGYITYYKFFDGVWTLPVLADDNSLLPDRIKKSKKSSKSDACKTFKEMWDRQNNDTHKEQMAIITDKGVFWLPDNENTVNTSVLGSISDFIGDPGSQSFVKDNVVYYIKAVVHTHPTGDQWVDSPSDKDVALAKLFKVPNYNISDGGIFKVSASGQISSVLDYNYENIFNCELDQNIVEELR